MEIAGKPTASPRAVIDRLVKATNDHDLDALVGCFSPDYVNATPVHPERGFTGREQVRRNWTQILTGVPRLVAEVTGWAENGSTVWTEWVMSGSRRDGSALHMAGVVIFSVSDDRISSARFYLEPVETRGDNVDAAVAAHMAGRS